MSRKTVTEFLQENSDYLEVLKMENHISFRKI